MVCMVWTMQTNGKPNRPNSKPICHVNIFHPAVIQTISLKQQTSMQTISLSSKSACKPMPNWHTNRCQTISRIRNPCQPAQVFSNNGYNFLLSCCLLDNQWKLAASSQDRFPEKCVVEAAAGRRCKCVNQPEQSEGAHAVVNDMLLLQHVYQQFTQSWTYSSTVKSSPIFLSSIHVNIKLVAGILLSHNHRLKSCILIQAMAILHRNSWNYQQMVWCVLQQNMEYHRQTSILIMKRTQCSLILISWYLRVRWGGECERGCEHSVRDAWYGLMNHYDPILMPRRTDRQK